MRRLVSFLGRARLDPTKGYRMARYRLSDGREIDSAFLGLSLAQLYQPDVLHIFGTSGSMWDFFLDEQCTEQVEDEERLRLWEAASANSVNELILAPFEPMLSQRIGIPCRLHVMPYARDETEQARLIQLFAGVVEAGDELQIDVTHGFRHLPMIVLAVARYLESIHSARVSDIVYGALDMQGPDGVAPVVDLRGLLRVLDWVQAISAYDASGDYGAIGGLLELSGVKNAGARLSRASFYERVTNHVATRKELNGLDLSPARSDPFSSLFLPEFESRTAWWRLPMRWKREAALARGYLARRDYLRAAIFAQEAVITRGMEERDSGEFEYRENTRKQIQQDDRDAQELFRIRNALAHGIAPYQDSVKSLLSDSESLDRSLMRLIAKLLG
jgi:CRISPR-associated Csx2 family protein